MVMAVFRDQNPPMAIPSSARPVIRTRKLGASATSVPETANSAAMAMRTTRRSSLPTTFVMSRLVITAKRPEMEIAWPACPSVRPRSCAIGLKRLTGMNSEAMRTMTQSVMAKTAPQAGRAAPLLVSNAAMSAMKAVLVAVMGSGSTSVRGHRDAGLVDGNDESAEPGARPSPNTVHFTILMAAAKSIRTVGCGVRDRSW
jgi:hypothetical protein